MRDIPLLDSFAARVAGLWAGAMALLIVAIVALCQGHFVFALDDPYIHLAVAHNLLGGGYGINAHELSSPSSSILWPWLMAISEAAGFGAFGPLALNLVCAGFTLLVGVRLLRATDVIDVEVAPRRAAGVVAAFAFVVSALGLPLLGLEHAAHVLACVLTVEALTLASVGRAPSLFHVVAIACLPLLRFEGAALFLSALTALAWAGRRREAGWAAALGVAGLLAYCGFMLHLGLPLLPSSVLAKSSVTTSLGVGVGAFLHALRFKFELDVVQGRAPALLALIGALLWMSTRPAARRRAPMLLAIAGALAGHLAFGAYGWFGRYEVYAVAIGALGLLIGLADVYAAPGAPLFAAAPKPPLWGRLRPDAASFVALLALGAPYALTAVLTPLASANVYGMQYQLRRLAQDYYPHPVAVNDIGLVSWGNPNYVLDLWGLGSEEARKLRKAGQLGPVAMERLARERHVEMVMIYDGWFTGAPVSWRPIGQIDRDFNVVTAPKVTVYLTPEGDAKAAERALDELAVGLPAGTRLERTPRVGSAAVPAS